MDLAVEYNGAWIKLIHKKQVFEKVKKEGLQQLLIFRDKFSSTMCTKGDYYPKCYLVIFDRPPDVASIPWKDRIKWFQEDDVTIVEC